MQPGPLPQAVRDGFRLPTLDLDSVLRREVRQELLAPTSKASQSETNLPFPIAKSGSVAHSASQFWRFVSKSASRESTAGDDKLQWRSSRSSCCCHPASQPASKGEQPPYHSSPEPPNSELNAGALECAAANRGAGHAALAKRPLACAAWAKPVHSILQTSE